MSLTEEITRRRTFGIISHPDAGKTTLTEKLLLFGGAIKTAGAVKSNKITHIVRGLTALEIADTLCISLNTVNTHRENLLAKTGVKNTAELVAYTIRNNIIDE